MADVEFKWDREGAERLLESTGPILKRKADAVAAAASLAPASRASMERVTPRSTSSPEMRHISISWLSLIRRRPKISCVTSLTRPAFTELVMARAMLTPM